MHRQGRISAPMADSSGSRSYSNHWDGPANMSASTSSNQVKPDRYSTSSSPEEGTRDDEGEAKKRRRIQQACKACSLRRVKCNGEKPCQTCLKNNDECVYGQPKKRGPAKGTTRGSRKERQRSNSPSTMATASSLDGKRGRSHSPSSVRASSNLLALQGAPATMSLYSSGGKASSDADSLYSRGSGTVASSIYNAGADALRTRSVYRGGTSGWDGGLQGDFVGADPASSRMRSISAQHRNERSGIPTPTEREIPRWPTLQYSSQDSPHSRATFSSTSAAPLPPAPLSMPTTDGPSTISRPPQSHPPLISTLGGERNRRQKELQDDELEVAEASLAAIFYELHAPTRKREGMEGRDNSQSARAHHDARSDLHQLEITLTTPVIGEEMKTELFHVFWTVISLYWPLFYRRAFDDEVEFRLRCERQHPFLFNAVCSIAALVMRDNKDEDKGSLTCPWSFRQLTTIFYARARYYNIGASQMPCLESAAALVLLSLRESGAGHSTEAARYCWSACRMALDLGLHRHHDSVQTFGRTNSYNEDESRKRIYWCAYVLDKTLAAQLGRPPILRSLESDCPLPSISDEEDEWTTWDQLKHSAFPNAAMKKLRGRRIGVSSYFINGCKLAVICESIIAQYNVVRSKQDPREQATIVGNLHRQLRHWMDSTPRHLKWDSKAAEGHLPYVMHQQVWAQVCMILIHRPYILKGSGISDINSHAECSRATEITCGILEEYEKLFGFHSLPSGSVYCLFTIATIALANTTSTEVEVASLAKKQLIQCISWLRALSRSWRSASHHVYILDKLAAGIDPGLAHLVMGSIDGEADHMQRTTSSDATVPPHLRSNIDRTLPSSSTLDVFQRPYNNPTGRDDYGLDQLHSVDAFWNDMPLGEDFDRWTHFAQAYFKAPTEMVPIDGEGPARERLSSNMPPPRPPPMSAASASSQPLPSYKKPSNLHAPRH